MYPPGLILLIMAEVGDVACAPNTVKAEELQEAKSKEDSIHNTVNSFTGFLQKRVLSSNSVRKVICVEGSFEQKPGTAIVVLEKEAFNEENLKFLLNDESTLKKVFDNDIYGTYECSPRQEFNTIKTTIIHPATEKHLKKYEVQPVQFIDETSELYQTVTLPHLQDEQFDIKWVYNILSHLAEADRIVFEDPDPETGFVLLPDLKWDCKQIEDLYLVAIVHAKGIKSLRDLTGTHTSLLENILKKGCEAIEEKYKLPQSKQRVYVHYLPSYYHFHVHFTNLRYDAPGINVGRAHLLSAVIHNLKLMPDYYQKAVLPYVLRENSSLFLKYEEMGLVKKTPAPEPCNPTDVVQE